MKTNILKEFEMDKEEALFFLFPVGANKAVGLTHDWRADQFFLVQFGPDGICKEPIGDDVSALGSYRTFIRNHAFGVVLFRTTAGLGLLIRDHMYLFDEGLSLRNEIRIVNDFPADKHHRHYAPAGVVEIANSHFLVTFSYCRSSPTYYSLLKAEETTAAYLWAPSLVDLHSPTAPRPSSGIVLTSVGTHEGQIVCHGIGPDRNWYKYGLDYSFLCRLSDGQPHATKICDVEKGFGSFSSDRKWFVLHPIGKKSTMHFCDTGGTQQGVLRLTPRKNLGFLRKDFLHVDVCRDSLWLYNANGVVQSEMTV